MNLDDLQTEARNPASARLDELSALEIVRLMNADWYRQSQLLSEKCLTGIADTVAGL